MLEKKFQTGDNFLTDHIMPTRTPVPFKGKHTPAPLSAKLSDRFYKNLMYKIKPLMKVRDAMEKIYSNGYFENHYPDADKELKRVLHEEAMVAHSRLRANDAPRQDEGQGLLGKNMSITINIEDGTR